MFDRDESSGGGGFALGLVIGALVGAVAALAYAPERGDVMRRKVGRKLRRASETARDMLEETADEVRGEIARRRRDVARNLGA